MKLFQIVNNICHCELTYLYSSLEEAKSHYSSDTIIVETPDYVFENWGYDETKDGEKKFIKPIPPEGWEYDENTGLFYNPTGQKKQELIQKIAELKEELSSTDYKIIKDYEYAVVGESAPYDMTELHTERQAIRDQINTLEAELAELEAEQ